MKVVTAREFTYLGNREAAAWLPCRAASAHKRSAGKVLVIGGCAQYHGAPLLAAAGAVRAGAGYVMLAYPKVLDTIVRAHVLEELCLPLPAAANGGLSRAALLPLLKTAQEFEAVVLGPGLGRSPEVRRVIREFIQKISGPRAMVIDADALQAIAGTRWKRTAAAPTLILTPHAGEAGVLLGTSAQTVEDNRKSAVQELARRYAAVVLLKGNPTLVADAAKPTWLVGSGTPALATAGTGDVLSGAIAALVAQKLAPKTAAVLGAYLHGEAGKLACPDPGGLGLRAREVAEQLPQAIRALRLAPSLPKRGSC